MSRYAPQAPHLNRSSGRGLEYSFNASQARLRRVSLAPLSTFGRAWLNFPVARVEDDTTEDGALPIILRTLFRPAGRATLGLSVPACLQAWCRSPSTFGRRWWRKEVHDGAGRGVSLPLTMSELQVHHSKRCLRALYCNLVTGGPSYLRHRRGRVTRASHGDHRKYSASLDCKCSLMPRR